jgi:hypothetical protein
MIIKRRGWQVFEDLVYQPNSSPLGLRLPGRREGLDISALLPDNTDRIHIVQNPQSPILNSFPNGAGFYWLCKEPDVFSVAH